MARVFLRKFPRLASKDTYLISVNKNILEGEWSLKQNDDLVSYWDTEMRAVVVLPEKEYKKLNST